MLDGYKDGYRSMLFVHNVALTQQQQNYVNLSKTFINYGHKRVTMNAVLTSHELTSFRAPLEADYNFSAQESVLVPATTFCFTTLTATTDS